MSNDTTSWEFENEKNELRYLTSSKTPIELESEQKLVYSEHSVRGSEASTACDNIECITLKPKANELTSILCQIVLAR